jgi:hypothetical protein
MIKFSKNKKLNGVLSDIYEDLLQMGKEEVKRYFDEFKNEIDYNVYQYGNLRIYNDDIKDLYIKNGYKTKFNYTETYKRQVGYMVRQFILNEICI